MLLYSIQKTANFQTQRGQCTKRPQVCRTHICGYGRLVGLVSLYVLWAWQCL